MHRVTRPFVVLALLAVTLVSGASAAPGTTAAPVPTGAKVRVSVAGERSPLYGTLQHASQDSLKLALQRGRTVVVARSAVTGLEFVSGRRPSTRRATLYGIGLGMAAGAGIGAAAGSVTLGEGGEEGAPRPKPTTSAGYRAIMGGAVGGLVGGVVGSLTGLGQSEEVWTPAAGYAAHALGMPVGTPPAPGFAIRIVVPLRGGSRPH